MNLKLISVNPVKICNLKSAESLFAQFLFQFLREYFFFKCIPNGGNFIPLTFVFVIYIYVHSLNISKRTLEQDVRSAWFCK